jgi:NTE family protein
MKKRALILSGGGNKGAFAGGVIQHWLEDLDRDYDLYVGTSTGSLLAPLTAIREVSLLKEGYTNVTNGDIFSIDPFRKNGKPSYCNIIKRGVMGKKTLGESKSLRNLIKQFFKETHFERLKKKEKEVIAVVANITDEKVEYKSSNDYEYEDFIDWLWASSNVELFMSILEKDGNQYADGGIYETVPIQVAIDHGATDIDVIVLNPEDFGVIKRTEVKNMFHYFFKIIRMMQRRIVRDNIMLGKLQSNKRDININIIYTPYRLTEDVLDFDKDTMLQWWDVGYEHAKKENVVEYKLTKSNVLKKRTE